MIFSSWIRNWKRSIERRWALHQTIRRKSIARRSATRPRLESLENRWVLSSYTINSALDSGTGTLRDAINQANALGTISEIDFNIGTVGSAQTINLVSQLPTLTASGVFLNGLSQGGSGNTTMLITLNGSGAGSSDGLLLQGSNCTISGLIIESFGKNGIEVDGSTNAIGGTAPGAGNVFSGNAGDGVLIDSGISGVQVQGNYIGTDPTGTTALANSVGVEDAGTGNTIGGTINTIGGSVMASRNIISGNSSDGILLDSTASGTTIQGNYIGINVADHALGNGYIGIDIRGNGMVVGGTSEGARNFISCNGADGVLIDSGASGIQIIGDYIGLSALGNVDLANGGNGIEDSGNHNTIGGSVLGARNTISGNTDAGILLNSSASAETVQSNYIGLDIFGTNAMANSAGIEVHGNNNTIGGPSGPSGLSYFFRNFISGNTNDGVLIDSGATGNQVQGNFIGLDIFGTSAVANGGNGIEIGGASNTIGSTSSAYTNVISGNHNYGVLLDGIAGEKNNLVESNYVGTDYTGKNAVSNLVGIYDAGASNTLGGSVSGARNVIAGNSSNDGILLAGSGSLVQGNYIGINASAAALANRDGIEVIGTNNTIGGIVAATRNIISGNSQDGVLIDSTASGTLVMGNFIGIGPSSAALANGTNGVAIAGSGNTIGGSVSGARNIISGNKNDGVGLLSTASGNLVQGNFIGSDPTGASPVSNSVGIEISGTRNIIGGITSGAANEISGNSADGVLLDSTASGNQVQGNYIGINHAGTGALANSVGVEILGASNTIGGSVSGARNVISGNRKDGVLLDSTASGVAVQSNYIGLDASGKTALANGSNGIEVKGTNNTIGGNSGSNYFIRNFISGNANHGVLIDSGASGNAVQGNFIGLDVSGTKGAANAANGIEIADSSNSIGGTVAGLGNVLSGNINDGILLDSSASFNVILGNDVGTDYTGQSGVANSGHGIEILGPGNTLGGTPSGARNIISGNSKDGVMLDSTASGNQVLGNYIGINRSSAALANAANGIEISGSSNSIGGTAAGIGNFISGNKLDGIAVDSTASSNVIQGNDIGTDYTGNNAVANSTNGIEVQGSGNTLGGTAAGARNIISGNSGDGVMLGSSASGTLIQGNYVGVNLSSAALANAANGIEIASNNNTIGGASSAARNIISGNIKDGVLLDSTASGNVLLGNFIGVNAAGTAMANSSSGVEIAGTQNTIGGTAAESVNVLSGNTVDGVLLDSTASGNVVLGNFIGINRSGNAVGNGSNGIEIAGTNNTLGSTISAARNIISANSNDGVLLDSTASGNQVLGNYIGTNAHGTAAQANKVGIEDAGTHNTLGGSVLGARNVISGNTTDGILMDSTASSETVQSNYIGLDVSGKTVLANGSNGVEIKGNNNTLGGNNQSSYFTRNFISGNSGDGVLIDSGATGNQVLGNFIGIDISGTKGAANASGIEIAGSGNSIGGTALGLGNTISGNTNDGVRLDSTAANNVVQGNDVGTDYTGKNALGNGGNGVSIVGANNTLGGSVAGAGNTITANGGDGVLVSVGVGDTLSRNSIFANSGGGISLSNGGNNNLAAATLTAATLIGNSLTVSGTFTAPTANVSYVLEFFANPSGDAEGKIYLGSLTVTPTSSGTQAFSFNTTTTVTGTNPLITATLTDAAGDTSTFSNGTTS